MLAVASAKDLLKIGFRIIDNPFKISLTEI
jgi:hypothetical protein